MNQTGQIIFIIFIVCYIIFWGAIIYIGIPKENRAQQKKKYDERQQIEQGRASRFAYITLVSYLVGYMMLDLFDVVWCELEFGLFLGIAFSISVFLSHVVFQDAYFAYNESKPGALIGINCIGLTQLVMGIECVTDGEIIRNGIITGNGVHLLFAAVVLLLDFFMIIRRRLEKKSI